MSKKQTVEPVMVTFFVPARKDGAFGFSEYVISEEDLKKHATLVKATEPDIFAIFVSHFTRAMREFFGL